jgi:signal transduction histidine kinase
VQLARQINATMDFQSIRDFLLPGQEGDPRFEEYLRRSNHVGLEIVGAVEIAAPLLMYAGRLAVAPETLNVVRLWQAAAMMLTGVVTLFVAATAWARRYGRGLAILSAWVAPTLLTWTALARGGVNRGPDDYALAAVTLVVLTAAATTVMLPWQALALGLSVEGMYVLYGWAAGQQEISSIPLHSNAHHVFLVMLALLAAGIASSNYRQRRIEFEAGQRAVRAAEALTGAQLRAQLAENAISIGKMAAALSHEINSPVGALRSAVETLMTISDRMIEAPCDQRDRLADTRHDLRRSIEESAARIDEVAKRLRRFVTLEEAELKSADLNELLADVALLHQEEIRAGQIRLEFDLERHLAPLTCRPQLLTAAFSSLLSNAIHAVNGNGRISIRTRLADAGVEVTIRDNGRGMAPEEADKVFDPVLKVSENRISSANWSLFNARQIVYEHGGDIRLETSPGAGTSVSVSLPAVVG